MNTHTNWPGLNAVIHHTLRRQELETITAAAQRCHISPAQLCDWARQQGIPLHVSLQGFLIEKAAVDSALCRRSPQSRTRSNRKYTQ